LIIRRRPSLGRVAEESLADARSVPGVHPLASIGDGALVHPLAVVSRHVRVGTDSVIGTSVYIGPNVIVGRNCTLYDYAFVHESSHIEDAVSVGPGAMLINGHARRAPTAQSDSDPGGPSDQAVLGVTVRTGAVIGARAVCVASVTVGRFAVVGARSVVTDDVPDFAFVAGAPATRLGWVGRTGAQLRLSGDGSWLCPDSGDRYIEDAGRLELMHE
jgi:acetyltransferase-like isoleucine patch superfamily enzyme